ncbi:MAG: hypothetical protein ABIE36_01745 [Candidatus Diapherotrites archaeon]
MKNIFIFLLLLFSIQTYSQIKVGGSAEGGYEDRLIRLKDDKGNDYASSFLREKEFAEIYIAANYKKFFLYTKIKTYFEYEKLYKYNPLQVEYTLGATYKFKWIELGYEHLCSHTIKFYFFEEAYDRFSVKSMLWEKTSSRIKTECSLELGYEDRLVRLWDGKSLTTFYRSYLLSKKGFAEIYLAASYKKISIYTDVKTYFECEKLYNYNPLQVEYYLGATYKIKWIEIGWKHLCSHSLKYDAFHEAYDRISVKFTLFSNIEK